MSVLPAHQTTVIGSKPNLSPKEASQALDKFHSRFSLAAVAETVIKESYESSVTPKAFPGIESMRSRSASGCRLMMNLPNAMVEF